MITPEHFDSPKKYHVLEFSVLRTLPTRFSEPVADLPEGSTVQVLRRFRTWYEVQVSGVGRGFVRVSALQRQKALKFSHRFHFRSLPIHPVDM